MVTLVKSAQNPEIPFGNFGGGKAAGMAAIGDLTQRQRRAVSASKPKTANTSGLRSRL